MSASLPPDYFERLYATNSDPWGFATSDYEAEKYAATIAALPPRRYRSAFEIGCSIGVLTAQLAPHCGRLLSVDVAQAPLSQARARCAGLDQVRFELMQVPQSFPSETFDLIVLSEVGYYLDQGDLLRLRALIAAHLVPRGILLMVHWTPFVHDYPITGDAVHEFFLESAELRALSGARQPQYRLDVLERQ